MVKNANPEPVRLSGYLVLAESSEGNRFHFLLSDLGEVLIMRLMKYVAGSEPSDHRVLARGGFGLGPDAEGWQPERLSYFVEPSRFTGDKSGRFWCLIDKSEALQMYQEWVEDPKYTEVVSAPKQNYFRNQVDVFGQQIKERKW